MATAMEQALNETLDRWSALSRAPMDDAEERADGFEASFYRLIDAVREWYCTLDPRPATLEELMAMPPIEAITDRLPAPLYLNFETEAELIIDNVLREEDERYD